MSAAQTDHLPWHQPVWDRLAACHRRGRVPHAIAVVGSAGLGKSRLAIRFAQALLCASPRSDGDGCGRCRCCHLQAAGSHPDHYAVHPESEPGGPIKIDQIRRLIEFLMRSSQYGGYRVTLVDPADRMTLAAANSLLKTLEEPPAAAVLILVARQFSQLPATLRSRCRLVQLQPPPAVLAREWLAEHCPEAIGLLALAGGAPLRAMAYAQAGTEGRYAALIADLLAIVEGHRSPVLAAQNWTGIGLRDWIELLQLALAELARAAFTECELDRIPGRADLQTLTERIDHSCLHDYMEEVVATRRILDQPLNEQLVIEDLFIRWRTATRGARLAKDRVSGYAAKVAVGRTSGDSIGLYQG
ncbi:DNA polymerase III subunit delta' [Nitrococcus mobilis]|uniref:DNA-directed DNA polymerase n=1 Tax=Nitrococcus mobilis Nb-231 TaxID=314278 RepID=A4BMM6_9GAMM|nr:DNA polymerase III subunit delta' [Nitrococcus mobilis]EAR23564.1 DNA polymerase III, delta prime subunit [Nitrococcus mobilis Nb-231]